MAKSTKKKATRKRGVKKTGKRTRIPRTGEHITPLSKDAKEDLRGYREALAGCDRMSTSDFRSKMAGSAEIVMEDGVRILVDRYERPIFAVVSLRDAAVLEKLDEPQYAGVKQRIDLSLDKKNK